MAMYKIDAWMTKSEDEAFDKVFKPGMTPVHSGIYRCLGCGREVVGEKERTLPSQNHHQHSASQGEIRWRLAAYCDPREK